MKLAIILLGISAVLGYKESYKGFTNCGVDGWTCNFVNGQHDITYTCTTTNPNARVWIWTARLPKGTSTFVVRDCDHLEVHFDCTVGLRTSTLQQFKVINVTNLEILPPMSPKVILHDNDRVFQAPPFLHISHVKKINFLPGMFDKPSGNCRYKFIELTNLTLENLHIERLMKDLFHDQNMHALVMKDVVIDAIDSNAMTIDANTTITGTTFPFVPGNAIGIKGESISFTNNTFKKIQTNGLIIKSRKFKFSNNYVEEINTQGLDVLGAKIEITNNVFNHLETGAFQKITPGFSPLTYEAAWKFTYIFSENLIKNISPGSIHINWDIYKQVCADIIITNNIFECSCVNLGWVSVSNGLGPKISKVKEFYDIYLNKVEGGNSCNGHNHCPLNAVIAQIQDVCNSKTNVSIICSSINNDTEADTETSPDDATISFPNSTQVNTEKQDFSTTDIEVTEKIIRVLSYTENQTSQVNTNGLAVWFIVLPIIIILATLCLGVFIWWYKKKKQRQILTTKYKNERGVDADSLIVINEHHNELFNKQ